jgi:hypothetical protein
LFKRIFCFSTGYWKVVSTTSFDIDRKASLLKRKALFLTEKLRCLKGYFVFQLDTGKLYPVLTLTEKNVVEKNHCLLASTTLCLLMDQPIKK